ncbi:MAG: hypothetical protein HY901_06995 [Deltaproteobacteria bacterium]|nr:hypothetical protein [Deltaproteobacteria bacterium]
MNTPARGWTLALCVALASCSDDSGTIAPGIGGTWEFGAPLSGRRTLSSTFASGEPGTAEPSVSLSEALGREMLPLPITAATKLGIQTAQGASEEATVIVRDARGHALGPAVPLAQTASGLEARLVLTSRTWTRGAAAGSAGGGGGGGAGPAATCAQTLENGVQLLFSPDQNRLELQLFSRLRLENPVGADDPCSQHLAREQAELASTAPQTALLAPLQQALQAGAIDAQRFTELAEVLHSAALGGTKSSNELPAPSSDPPTDWGSESGGETTGPITVDVPALVPVDATATIQGTVTVADPDAPPEVEIRVRPPGGTEQKSTVRADSSGQYRFDFTGTTTVGTYQVEALQGSANQAKAAFTVALIGDIGDRVSQELLATYAIAESVLDDADTMLDGLPPSPEREETRTKVAEARTELQKGKELAAQVKSYLDPIMEVAQVQPALAEHLEAGLVELGDWAAEAPARRQEWTELLERARMRATLCDQLEYAIEAFGALATAMTFAAEGTNILLNFVTGHLLPAAINQLPFTGPEAADQKFTVTEAQKVGVGGTQGMASTLVSFLGLANSLSQWATRRLLAAYCERFEGPIEVAYRETWWDGSAPWMKSFVKLNGKIVVRYPKSASADGDIAVTGHIEGNASKFAFWEDVFVIEEPPPTLVLLTRFAILPRYLPFDMASDPLGFGMFVRLGTPAYFHVPIEGTLRGETIAIKALDATVDFSDVVKTHAVLIFYEPILFMPLVRVFEFPVQKAQTILRVGLGLGGTCELPLTVDTANGRTTFDRTLEKEWTSGDQEVEASWVLSLKGSNPP